MLPALLSIPVLTLLAVFQSAVLSRVTLLYGMSDLLLLAVVAWALQERVRTAWHWSVAAGILYGIYSALPFGVALVGYLATTSLALVLRRRVWKVPVLAMLVTVFFGTLLTHGLSILVITLQGANLPFGQTLNLITLPSLLLNMLLAAPVYLLIGDLASWAYPKEVEV